MGVRIDQWRINISEIATSRKPLYNIAMEIKKKQKTYVVKNDIVCRDAISRDKEQCLVIDLEDFANLAGSDLLDIVLAEVNLGNSCVGSHDVRSFELCLLCLLQDVVLCCVLVGRATRAG